MDQRECWHGFDEHVRQNGGQQVLARTPANQAGDKAGQVVVARPATERTLTPDGVGTAEPAAVQQE
jgi:hypothetical protein